MGPGLESTICLPTFPLQEKCSRAGAEQSIPAHPPAAQTLPASGCRDKVVKEPNKHVGRPFTVYHPGFLPVKKFAVLEVKPTPLYLTAFDGLA